MKLGKSTVEMSRIMVGNKFSRSTLKEVEGTMDEAIQPNDWIFLLSSRV